MYKNHEDKLRHERNRRATKRFRELRKTWPSNSRRVKYKPSTRTRFNNLLHGAGKRGIVATLTLEQYAQVIAVGICFYCSRPLPEFGHGVDRKDNSSGYTPENSLPCCAECNEIKRDKLTFDEMVWIMAHRKVEGYI